MKPLQELLPTLSPAPDGGSGSRVFAGDLLCEPDCPICGGLGHFRMDVPVGHPQFGKTEICPNAKQRLVQRMIAQGSLDPRVGVTAEELRELSWRTLKPPSAVHNYIPAFRLLYQRGWGMCALLGVCGVGKTTTLKIFVVSALHDGKMAAYANTSRVLDDIRRAYDQEQAMSELIERTDWWANLDVLCLDEFDKVNHTAWAQERLFAVFDTRYELAVRGKAITVIATNYETLDPFPPYIRSRLEDELFTGYIIHLKDADIRPRRSQMRDDAELPQPKTRKRRER